jgi:hypothetical protein
MPVSFCRAAAFATALVAGSLALEASASAATSSKYFNIATDKPGTCALSSVIAPSGVSWAGYSQYVPTSMSHRGKSITTVSNLVLLLVTVPASCDDLRNEWVHGLLDRIEAEARKKATAAKANLPALAACDWPIEGAEVDASVRKTEQANMCLLMVKSGDRKCPGLKDHSFRRVAGYTEIGKAALPTSDWVRVRFEFDCETARVGKEERKAAEAREAKEKADAAAAAAANEKACKDAEAAAVKNGYFIDSKGSSPSVCAVPSCCTTPEPLKAGSNDCGKVKFKVKSKDKNGKVCN